MRNYKKISLILVVCIFSILAGCTQIQPNPQPAPQPLPQPQHPATTTLTILVPQDEDAYRKAMLGEDQAAAAKIPFIKKTVVIPYTTEVEKASANAAAGEIPPGGGPAHATVAYFKMDGDTAYVLLNIDLDSWAGSSFSKMMIRPLVEKTLLQFPKIKKVVFDALQPDTVDSIRQQMNP